MATWKGSLKVTGNKTIGYITHDLLLVELFDAECYCDLEMWVRGNLKKVIESAPFESLVSYSQFIITVAVSFVGF